MWGRLVLGVVVVLFLVGCATAPATLSGPEPTADAVTDLEAVQVVIDAGNYDSARATLEGILATDETNAEAHFKLGLVMFNLGDYQTAKEHFSRSLELEPDRAAAVHHNLGVLAYQLGDIDTALVEFQAALDADPDDADTHYQLGATYLIQAFPMGALSPDEELLGKARAEFERSLEITPEKPEALVGLANIHMLNDEMAEAIDLLESAVAQNPDMREALFALGRSYIAVGEIDKARDTLNHFLTTNPPEVWAQQAEEMLGQLGGE